MGSECEGLGSVEMVMCISAVSAISAFITLRKSSYTIRYTIRFKGIESDAVKLIL